MSDGDEPDPQSAIGEKYIFQAGRGSVAADEFRRGENHLPMSVSNEFMWAGERDGMAAGVTLSRFSPVSTTEAAMWGERLPPTLKAAPGLTDIPR